MSLDETRILFVGAGNMASALIRGLRGREAAPAHQIAAVDLDTARVDALREELGVLGSGDLRAHVDTADVIVIAVKPQVVASVLPALADAAARGALVVSVAAGVSLAALEAGLGGSARVIRTMPNTPALVGEGATAICKGQHASDADLSLARALFETVGATVVVSESLIDAVTGLSGSGPAYVFLFLEALADGAVRMGLPRDVALTLAAQTVRGAATLMAETKEHPGALKDQVTSPGGTTIAGVHALESGGFRNTVIEAVVAATKRSQELGQR